MRNNGFEMVSRYCICKENQDCMNHTLWNYNFSVQIWSWICSIFDFSNPTSFEDICKATQRNIPLVKEIWMTAACATMKELWFQRNKKLFEEVEPDLNSFKCRIWKLVHEGGCRMKGSRWGQSYDQQIIEFFKMGVRFSKYSCIKACYWSPPNQGYLLLCCDGTSFGNPGNAGFGIIVKDEHCSTIGTLSGGLGITTNYIVECFAVLCVVEWDILLNATRLIIRSDSKSVINEFSTGLVPWFIKTRWRNAIRQMKDIIFEHCYREINFSADSLAKRGA
ncbi:uncharacterized protein LOC113311946 [Papaver somniferum]|uniref:uncharacterized protein LOC113311946 n=1 Tax=Papaver somniferum TaxID=3469 RepID=UPI000E6F46DC|nr:uncharacterized protein LOC113311946 [Papaver somniferum]